MGRRLLSRRRPLDIASADDRCQRIETRFLLDMQHPTTEITSCVVPIHDDNSVLRLGFHSALPEDVFWHIFSFLRVPDLANICQVSWAWMHAAYSPYIWSRLELYRFRFRVNSQFLDRFIANPRFTMIRELCLDDCTAFNISSLHHIAASCPTIRELSLLRCRQLLLERPKKFSIILDLVFKLLRLQKLELYGCCSTSAVRMLVRRIREINRQLDLGLLQMQWSSQTGLNPNGEPYRCRLAQESNFNGRVCWGPISGNIIFTNQDLNVHGNLPSYVLYSCVAHSDLEEDVLEGVLGQCSVCFRLFADVSMADRLHCRTCHDHKLMRDIRNWTQTDTRSINQFIQNAERPDSELHDRRNLPKSLTFDETLTGSLSSTLQQPRWKEFKRILVARHENGVHIWADNDAIVKGVGGQTLIDTCLALWRNAFGIVYPVLVCLVIVSFFLKILSVLTSNRFSPQPSSAASTIARSREESVETQQLAFIAIVVFVSFCIVQICVRQHRDLVLNIFRRILVLDFFLIFVFGLAISLILVSEAIGIPLDFISLFCIAINYAALNIVGLYFLGVPPKLRRFSIVSLNCMMTIVVVLSLNPVLIPIILCVPVFFDTYCQFNRHRSAVPLLLFRRNDDHPEGLDIELHNPLMHIQPDNDESHIDPLHDRPPLSFPAEWVPRLFYQVEDVEMRMFDFLWYGLMLSIPEPSTLGLTISSISIFFAIVFAVMLAPFFQIDIKPLPFALILVLVMELARLCIIEDFLKDALMTSLNL